MVRKNLQVSLLLVLVLLSSSCAVMHAPQINTETQWRLNTVAELNALQNNYLTFFTDVGVAHRAGTLSDNDVNTLNSIGRNFKVAIENANTVWLSYVAAPSGDKKTQVINLLLTAEQIFLNLTTQKTQMIMKRTGGLQ